MQMDEGMDTGDILSTETVDILPNETAEELFERLSLISAELMVTTLEKIKNGEITPIKQNDSEATYAPIIKKEMAYLDFTQDAEKLACAVRGYYSWPCAYFFLDGKRIKVISAKVSDKTERQSGEVIDNNNRLVISCGNNTSIELLTVQPEGSKSMSAAQMLCGKKIPLGTKVN